jgi:hypothetical protein
MTIVTAGEGMTGDIVGRVSRGDARVLPGLLFLLGVALSAFTILQGIAPHDEGLMLQAGSRIASGQWIYRDFWLNYPPGQPLVLAGLHGLFGASLLTWRIVRSLTDGGVALLAYLIVRRRGIDGWPALLVWLAVAGAMAWPTGPGPNPPALLLCFAALLAALGERPGLAGALAGVAFAFRFELGLATVAAVLILTPSRRALVAAAAGAVLPLVPFLITSPGALWHDTFGFYGIQDLQRLPFPLGSPGSAKPNKLLEYYLPAILVAGAAVYGARVLVARDRFALALVPLVAVSLAYLLGRTDEFHLIPLSAVLPVALGARYARRGQIPRIERTATLAAALVVALIALHGLDRRAESLIHPGGGAAVPGPAADGVQTTAADAAQLRGLYAAVRRLTRPGEPIFVADPRHDRVTAGDPLLYVILGHPNPTRYDVMQPGLITTASVQREIIGELTRTRVVVRWLDPRAEAAAPRVAGSHVLDRYLARRFSPRQRFGVYQLLERRR